ncbi:hypothetical protein F8M41_022224 [Gigaspora margarita]|uniref:Uncharacterized protein n=1 Tax=Gigaspora margarita TaxID=4874 RepID=A0A8H4ETR9_GIGMA|nr:hypothetical protein F8M41_022224 [Gigaspora margarita]
MLCWSRFVPKYPLPTIATTPTLRTTQPQSGLEATLVDSTIKFLVSLAVYITISNEPSVLEAKWTRESITFCNNSIWDLKDLLDQ